MSGAESSAGHVGEVTHPRRDPRPTFRVALFGLGSRMQRVTEIVLRHARHNRYRFVLAQMAGPAEFDIAMVDMTAEGAVEVENTLRRMPQQRPVVRVGRRNDAVRGKDDLLQSGFTMKLLDALNRVAEEMLLRPSRPAHEESGVVYENGVARRPRALIVDDSPTVRSQLAKALQLMGIESDGAEDVTSARRALAARRYELAFVDVGLPDIDGFRLTREIKRDRLLRSMPVIILTSRSSPFDLARGALAGCNTYLVKPITLQSLRDTVARHLRLNARLALARSGMLRPA